MANLGANILQNIEDIQKEVLYDIYVYIQKVYDALDWGRALAVLEGWGVGTQVLQMFESIPGWRNGFMVGFLGVRMDAGSNPKLVKRYQMWGYILLGGISPNTTLVRHSISLRGQYSTLQWQRRGGKYL